MRDQGHVILRKLANLIDFRFLHVCVPSTQNFVSKILEMLEKIKTNINNRLLLVSEFKKKSSILT